MKLKILCEYEVTGGNFKMVVVNEGRIVATVEPDEDNLITTCTLEGMTGDVSILIAGESASFRFLISEDNTN